MVDKDNSGLSIEEVEHLSMLARMGASKEDLEQMRKELTQILENFKILQDVGTDGVEPTAHVVAIENVFRDDASRPSNSREETLGNAPSSQEGYVRVRGVLDDQT